MKVKTLAKSRYIVALTMLTFLLLLCLIGQFYCQDMDSSLVNLDSLNIKPFTEGHLLGTDSLGHDIFATACLGARNSLTISLLAALVAVFFGTAWGALGAISHPSLSALLMRTVDALLSIPSLIMLLSVTALIRRPEFVDSIPNNLLNLLGVSQSSLGLLPVLSIILVIASSSWLEAARITFIKFSTLMVEEYVLAAHSIGAGKLWLTIKHLLPNSRRIILLQATLLISDAVVMEAGLSFLGLGLGPDTPSWGGMLRQAQADLFYGNWWAPLIPAILISCTILSINLLGQEDIT